MSRSVTDADLAHNPPGAIFYVDGANGNDGSDGLSWGAAKATIQGAVNACTGGIGETILIAPGAYNETVTIAAAKSMLTLKGMGGRGAAFIEPSAAGAEGMQVNASDVTLINLGVAGDDTSDYALNVHGNGTAKNGRRFRAIGCKFEKADGAGAVVLLDGTADYNVGDAMFHDCEFAWGGVGLQADDSGYGYVTQVYVKDCWFHNIATACIGVATNGLWKNLNVIDCQFDNKEDGTAPTDYILLSDNGNTGLFSGNRFATATNATGVLTIGTGIKWGPNGTEAGWSTARPA